MMFTVPALALPPFGHVVIIVEENYEFDQIIGNPDMPYLNSLANRFGLATQFYGNTHPSIGNYFMMTTGAIVTNDDLFAGTVPDDNIVRQLIAAGKTWKAYAQSLPYAGFTGPGPSPYAQWHNPFSFFTDVVGVPAQANNIVPFSQFAADLAADALPMYSFVIPDLDHDAHNGTRATADSFLQTAIAPLLADPHFQQNGLLIICFDEGTTNLNGGGRIAWVAVSPFSKAAFQSAAFYQHESTLRLSAEGLGLVSFPGAAATAANMGEFFNAAVNAAAPTIPAGLALSRTTPISLTFTWQTSIDDLYVSHYLLDLSTDSNFGIFAPGYRDLPVMNIADRTVFTAGDLAPNTLYHARLRAKDIAGNVSGYSAGFTMKTPPVPDSVQGARAFPNPFIPSQGHSVVTFADMSAGAAVRIYTLSGEAIKDLAAGRDGRATWDGTNETGQRVASGVYFVVIRNGDDKKTLKVAIVR